MDVAEIDGLRRWAVLHAECGMIQARQVLGVLDELDRLRRLNEGLCERVASQSHLLSKKAECVEMELTGAGLVVGIVENADE